MALQPRSRTHQAYAQFRGHPVSTSKEDHLVLSNIHLNYIQAETGIIVSSMPRHYQPSSNYSQNGSCVPSFETLIGNFEVENETLN